MEQHFATGRYQDQFREDNFHSLIKYEHLFAVRRSIEHKAKVLLTWALLLAQRCFGKEVNLNFVMVAMVLGVVLLSFLMPDLPKVFRRPREVNEMYKIIDLLTVRILEGHLTDLLLHHHHHH